MDASLGQFIQHLAEILEEFPAPDVHHQRQLCVLILGLQAQLNEFRNEGRGKIVHTKIAQIFQRTHHLRLPRAGHPCDE